MASAPLRESWLRFSKSELTSAQEERSGKGGTQPPSLTEHALRGNETAVVRRSKTTRRIA